MNENTNLSAADAADLLATAESASDRGDASGRSSGFGIGVSVSIAALVAAFLLAAVYVLPVASGPIALLVSVVYAAGIVVAVTVYNVGRRVTPSGWNQRYQRGLAATMGLFAAALALSFLVEERSIALWLPIAILTALPLALLGSTRARS